MTEQEYQELKKQEMIRVQYECLPQMSHIETCQYAFKAGAEWARRNPGPEVQKLIKIAKIATIYLDQEICRLEYDLPESLSGYLMHLGHTLKKSLAKFDVARSEK